MLTINNLSFGYSDQNLILNNFNFKIKKGEHLCVMGESGCGKTTTARAILHLIKPTSGDIFFDYYDETLQQSSVINLPKIPDKVMKQVRKKAQMIFQDPYSSLNPRFKVRDIIAEPIKFFQKNISNNELLQNVYDLIDIVGMTRQSLDRYPHEFSGGQRQIISIARALATRPRLLICDEPTSALDLSIQSQIIDLLKKLQKENNLGYIFISHDLRVIQSLAHQLIVLKNGKIVESGSSDQIFKKPKQKYTKELISAAFEIK